MKEALKQRWPKKCSVGEFATRWYTKPCSKTVINRIKSGKLPGGQEHEKGPWYVWVVNSNLDPAFGYDVAANDSVNESKGSAIADAILTRLKA